VERYDIAADSWQAGPKMNQGRYYHASCSLGDYCYVICGFDGSRMLDSLERLDNRRFSAEGGAQWQLLNNLGLKARVLP